MLKQPGCADLNRFFVTALVAAMLAWAPDANAADDAVDPAAQKLVESIYGGDLRQVAQTPSRLDDIELAARMLQSAAEIQDNPAAAALMCERALALTETIPTARDVAIKAGKALYQYGPKYRTRALDALIELHEDETRAQRGDERREVGEKLLNLLERAAGHAKVEGRYEDAANYYRRALGIATFADPQRKPLLLDRVRGLREMLKLVAEADRLMADLKVNPDDKAAGFRVVRVLLELDRLDDARKYSFLASDRMAEMIKLASAPPEQLTAEQTLAVADWYAELATQATAAPSVTHLKRRAIERYERLAAAGSGDNATRQRVDLAASKLRQDLGDDAPDAPGAGGFAVGRVDADGFDDTVMKRLLKTARNNDGWVDRDGVLLVTEDSRVGGITALTYKIDQSADKSYTMVGEIRWRHENAVAGLQVCGTGRMALLFTHQDNAVLLGIDGRPLKVLMNEAPAVGQWHKFEANVEEKGGRIKLQLVVDGRVALNWNGEVRELTAPLVDPRDDPHFAVGVVAGNAGTEFRHLALKTHDGIFRVATPPR